MRRLRPKDIVEKPELRVYTDDFGTRQGDNCLVAVIDNQIIGAVWTRIMDDYGHVDDDTPSFAISLYNDYRVQCMHIGSYDDEPITVALMHDFMVQQGYALDITDKRLHHEIYLSDARKVAPEKLKTVIRHPIK